LGDRLHAFDVPGGLCPVPEEMVPAGLNDYHHSTPHP
jgi:hypothetical protein